MYTSLYIFTYKWNSQHMHNFFILISIGCWILTLLFLLMFNLAEKTDAAFIQWWTEFS